MRKLKLQMQVSVDGFVAGPNGEMDWMVWNWDDELKKYVAELTHPVDCIVIGRKLAEGFIPHWAAAVNNPEEKAFAVIMHDTPKVVFSKTLKKSGWENAKLATGNLADEITRLKNATGSDIITYGGATLASNLVNQNLIDEYHLFVNPAAIGKGMSIFKNLDDKLNLNLVKSKSFDCGIVGFHYEPKK